jgi:hypothetical protein
MCVCECANMNSIFEQIVRVCIRNLPVMPLRKCLYTYIWGYLVHSQLLVLWRGSGRASGELQLRVVRAS